MAFAVGRTSFDDRLGRRLKNMRVKRDWTQLELANIARLDRSFISDLERGEKSPTLRTLNVLALTYGMTVSELLEGV